jgi:two-component system copper resistance phosphate regulon response regulator CusR
MGIRVLVVEDEAKIADFLIRGLREEGYAVEHASDGGAAWHALRSGEWDLVLLDWWLPGEDGMTLLQRFRQLDRQTPVLFLTARDAVSDRVRGLDAGADDYLSKPFAYEELLARVRALVRRRDATESTTLVYRDVRVDLATQRAERGGHALHLTAKEQALLVFFLRHSGQVLSRTRIYEHVWDERYDGLSNTLEVHVKELRRKLEAHGSRLIHTLRGRGYLLGDSPDAPHGED